MAAKSFCANSLVQCLNEIPFPNLEILHVEKYLMKMEYISKNDESYEKKSIALEIPKIDERNVFDRATFTGQILAKCWTDKVQNYISIADFSEPEQVLTHFARQGGGKVYRFSVEELLKRPKETRLSETYFSFTGDLRSYYKGLTRSKAMDKVRSLGGMAEDTTDTQNVTHFVVGIQRETTGKSRKEIEFEESGAVRISPEDFLRLIEE